MIIPSLIEVAVDDNVSDFSARLLLMLATSHLSTTQYRPLKHESVIAMMARDRSGKRRWHKTIRRSLLELEHERYLIAGYREASAPAEAKGRRPVWYLVAEVRARMDHHPDPNAGRFGVLRQPERAA